MNEIAVGVARMLITRWEGFSNVPYLCPAGVPTIGFGFTHYRDGTAVTLNDPPMSREAALELLDYFIRTKYMPAAMTLCPNIDTEERLGAITDFCFNLGAGALRASTLRQKINAGAWSAVPTQLRRWTKANGRVLHGLVLRREAEIQYI
jgi:lysozyme